MVNSWEITQGYFLASIACDAIKEDWENGDIKLAIEDALESMFLACQRDLEYYESTECFVESCEANEWTFLENGELFHVWYIQCVCWISSNVAVFVERIECMR